MPSKSDHQLLHTKWLVVEERLIDFKSPPRSRDFSSIKQAAGRIIVNRNAVQNIDIPRITIKESRNM